MPSDPKDYPCAACFGTVSHHDPESCSLAVRSGEARQPETSETTVAFSGFNPEQSATLKLRLDVERYNRTGEAVYLDASGREIKFVAASDPWDRSAAPVPVREERPAVQDAALETLTDEIRTRYAAVARAEVEARREVSRLQSALDALATAWENVAAMPLGDRGGVLVEHGWSELDAAISSLLSTRETT